MNTSEPRFVVDCMLGKLAKWLRILGFDVWYFNNIDDEELIKKNRDHGRILLTRDTRLIQRSDIGAYIFIESDHLIDQILQVIKSLSLKLDSSRILKRCIVCNGIIEEVDCDQIQGEVPDYIFYTHRYFFQCKLCKKIYWSGSHKNKINAFIKTLKEDL